MLASRPVPATHRLTALATIAMLMAVALAYAGIRDNGFHFDDWPNILDNSAIHMTHLGVTALLDAARGAYLPLRPVPAATFAIDWWRGGPTASVFLVTNLVFHLLAACATFALLLRILSVPGRQPTPREVFACALASLWWAAQPIHVQAVSYVVQRMTELAALFSLLAVYCWLKARGLGRSGLPWFVACAASVALAALSKENAWITPLLLVMAEYLVVRNASPLLRSRGDRVLVGLLVVTALAALADLSLGGPISGWALQGYERRDFTLAERLLTQPKVVLFHVSQLLWPDPARFSLEHDVTLVRSASDWHFWLPALLIAAWCAAGSWVAARPGRRVVGFFMLWLPVTLFIESSFVPLELVFEHRMYLPTVGLAGLIALALCRAADAPRPLHIAAYGLAVCASLAALWSTHQRLPQWRTEESLYAQATRLAPGSARTWNLYGIALLNQRRSEPVPPERFERAMEAFAHAIALDAAYPAPWTNRGVARLVQGDVHGAIEDLRHAISLSSREAAAQHYLGEAYARVGRHDDARISRKRACALGVQVDCPR